MAPGSRDTATTAELVVTAGAHARALKPSSTNQRSSARGHANWSPTLSNRSLPSAVRNGFRKPETGGAETPKRGASARSETHNPRTQSPKSLKRVSAYTNPSPLPCFRKTEKAFGERRKRGTCPTATGVPFPRLIIPASLLLRALGSVPNHQRWEPVPRDQERHQEIRGQLLHRRALLP